MKRRFEVELIVEIEDDSSLIPSDGFIEEVLKEKIVDCLYDTELNPVRVDNITEVLD